MSTIVRVMLESDLAEANRFLHQHFERHEPLLESYFGDAEIEHEPFENILCETIVREGLSLVAVDQRASSRIVGVAYAGALSGQELEESWQALQGEQRSKYFDHIHYFLINIKRNAQIFARYGIAEALYLKVLAVDDSMYRQGLGRRLVGDLMELGRSKGHALLVATCTGLYSTRLMASLGMECLHSELYSEFKDDAGHVMFRPAEPHTKASIMAIKL